MKLRIGFIGLAEYEPPDLQQNPRISDDLTRISALFVSCHYLFASHGACKVMQKNNFFRPNFDRLSARFRKMAPQILN